MTNYDVVRRLRRDMGYTLSDVEADWDGALDELEAALEREEELESKLEAAKERIEELEYEIADLVGRMD